MFKLFITSYKILFPRRLSNDTKNVWQKYAENKLSQQVIPSKQKPVQIQINNVRGKSFDLQCYFAGFEHASGRSPCSKHNMNCNCRKPFLKAAE